MDTLFTIILVTVLLFYLLRLVGRWALRYFIAKKQREFSERFSGNYGGGEYRRGQQGAQESEKKRKEGEVTVHHTERVEKKVSSSVGDYVDFEEVEEGKS